MNKNDDKKGMKEKSKVGHRRVTDEGTVTYKRKTTSDIQQAIQMGIRITVLSAHNKAKRDMLLKDFGVVDTLAFPKMGSKDTPSHSLSDFKFKTFAPIAFRYFRDFFEVDISDYLNSICQQELRELSNAGASGSIFYITYDDEFIIKTVQHKEANFLQKLLPEYYINLMQHPRTLLPKFYGLYCYQTMGKNIRFVIMNNLLPSIQIHEKYDLKGSTYKRMASFNEKSKASPTLKDLDFRESHPDGLFLEVDTYEALLNTIQRDCRVLESFRIMDYSLLLGIHNLDIGVQGKLKRAEQVDTKQLDVELTKEKDVLQELSGTDVVLRKKFVDEGEDMKKCDIVPPEAVKDDKPLEEKDNVVSSNSTSTEYFTPTTTELTVSSQKYQNSNSNNQQAATSSSSNQTNSNMVVIRRNLDRQASRNKSTRRIAAYSTVLESIQAPIETFDLQNTETENIPAGGIPARNKLGDRLILFMGIIDILQSYRFSKKLEHNMKAIFLDAETISVTNPNFYGQRFQEFFGNAVFKKIPSLDQPQMLGNHARRFRNFVHLAMRQQPEKKMSIVKNDMDKSMESLNDGAEVSAPPGILKDGWTDLSESDTQRESSDEVTMPCNAVTDENNRPKSHVSFPNLSSSK